MHRFLNALFSAVFIFAILSMVDSGFVIEHKSWFKAIFIGFFLVNSTSYFILGRRFK